MVKLYDYTEQELEILPWHQYPVHTTEPAMLVSLMNLIISFSIAKRAEIKYYLSALNWFGCNLPRVSSRIVSTISKVSSINHNKTFFTNNRAKDT